MLDSMKFVTSNEHSLLERIVPEIRNFRILAILRVGDSTFLGLPRRKTHPLQAKFSSNEHALYLHAEIDAIRQALTFFRYHAPSKLSQASLHVLRIRQTKPKGSYEECLAKPCEGCMRAIRHYGITNVTWST
jgi:deoxycytidylate deaminase